MSAIKSPEGKPFREVRTAQGADECFLKKEVFSCVAREGEKSRRMGAEKKSLDFILLYNFIFRQYSV